MNRTFVSVWWPLAALMIACCGLHGLARALDDAQSQKVLDGTDARRQVMLKNFLASPPLAKKNVMWNYTDFAMAAWGDFGSGVVTICKDHRNLVLDSTKE